MSSFPDDVPCKDSDPWMFDQFNLDLAQAALGLCSRCNFWSECEVAVNPKPNLYDGVAAGKVWRNGRILAKLDADSPSRFIVGQEIEEPENFIV